MATPSLESSWGLEITRAWETSEGPAEGDVIAALHLVLQDSSSGKLPERPLSSSQLTP